MTMLDLAPTQSRALRHIVCMTCRGEMLASPDSLTCERCGTSYRVDANGIVRTLTGPPERMSSAVRMGQWSWVARLYDRVWRTHAMSLLSGERFSPEREVDIVADTISLGNGTVYLDNACANGFYARNIARRLRDAGKPGVVFAVDASLPMLRTAKRLAQNEGVADRVVFIHAMSERLPFADYSFDGIACGGSLNEFVSPDDVLRELRRVLDPRSGAFSLMFQVRSTRVLKGLGQRLLARLLGLRIYSLREAIERVRTYFSPEIRFYGDMALMIKCTSRIRTVAYQRVLAFSSAEQD